MEEQKKKQNGITLIALVISIIVMLILAGVSLNMTIGENGIVTKAQEAKEAFELSQTKEELEMMFAEYNVDDNGEGIVGYLRGKVSKGEIDDFQVYNNGSNIVYLIKKNGEIFYVAKEGDFYYATQSETQLDSIGSGITVVTQSAFSPDPATGIGNISFDGLAAGERATLYFYEEIAGKFNFDIPRGTVDIYVTQNMTLTNQGVTDEDGNGRSAIDVHSGATLNLYISDGCTLSVDSGYGTAADENTPGKGGYAGIHVPSGATLHLYGIDVEGVDSTAKVIAIGGNAGRGGTPSRSGNNNSASGGGGAGAGIGGHGANGGQGVTSGVGYNGKTGEDCGNVFIHNDVIVYAYGGAGGGGGAGSSASRSAGGAGGYPAAGIGGGGASGAGSTCCAGAGGYTGGTGDEGNNYNDNGLYGYGGGNNQLEGGGGYFLGGIGDSKDEISLNRSILCYGGFSNQGSQGNFDTHNALHASGDGGIGGKGGTVKVSELAKVYAFNGNLFTDGKPEHAYNDGLNQCPIYAQNGQIVAKYQYTGAVDTKTFRLSLVSDTGSVETSGYTNLMYTENTTFAAKKTLNINTLLGITGNTLLTNVDMSKQGVGSGAGYIEIDNGKYMIDPNMN